MSERWQEKSLCQETDPELFFRERGTDSTLKAARKICQMCDVFDQCKADAIANPDPHAIKAGMTPSEQKKAHRAA